MHDERPLYTLDGKRLGDHTVRLGTVTRGAFAGVFSFSLRINGFTIVSGLYYAGSKWIKPWLEVDYTPVAALEGLEEELFHILAELIPPGGHLSVFYGVHKVTARALLAGVPPAATPLGFLLWQSGFRWFKDWYFAEGWKEGGMKLQGEKPLNEARDRTNTEKVIVAVKEFLAHTRYLEPEIEAVCKQLALKVLEGAEL